jgi:hypothetical protein
MTPAEIRSAVTAERDRQRTIWGGPHDWGSGDCSSPDVRPEVKVAVLAEECGEVARAVLDHDDEALRRELIQVAAVCAAWLELLPQGSRINSPATVPNGQKACHVRLSDVESGRPRWDN